MVERIFSSGWGVQSTAIFLLQVQGMLSNLYDAFVFANVGDDSENPRTLAYYKAFIKPLAESSGVVEVEVRKEGMTLLQRLMSDQKSVVIPAYTKRGKGKLHRNCTTDYKIAIIDDWCKSQGANSVTVGLGISLDEVERARDQQWYTENGLQKRREYPLLTRRMSRLDCMRVILTFGWPLPPPSRCFFCPFNSESDWVYLMVNDPDLFELACKIDERIRGKESSVQGRAYLHRRAVALRKAVGNQLPLFEYAADDCGGTCGV